MESTRVRSVTTEDTSQVQCGLLCMVGQLQFRSMDFTLIQKSSYLKLIEKER